MPTPAPLQGKARLRKLRDMLRQAGMTCGAWARTSGAPCKQPPVHLTGKGNGRCRFHGGLSTGPKTREGYARMLLGASKGGRRTVNARKQAQARQQPHDAGTGDAGSTADYPRGREP